MVKEGLFEKLVEVRRVGDRVMAVVLVFEEYVVKLICLYARQSGIRLDKNNRFIVS